MSVSAAPSLSITLRVIVCIPKLKSDLENIAFADNAVFPSLHKYPTIEPSESLEDEALRVTTFPLVTT